MAEERVDSREATWRALFPWTELFRAFQVALDLNKLLLAAAGIAVMAFGWWLLATIFSQGESKIPPAPTALWFTGEKAKDKDALEKADKDKAKEWAEFRRDRLRWNLMNEAVGLNPNAVYEVADFAETYPDYATFKAADEATSPREAFLAKINELKTAQPQLTPEARGQLDEKIAQYALLGKPKPFGRLYVGPWFEDRGPNPYLLATGQTGIPWEPGHFWEWFIRDQAPVMFEPLVKLARPIFFFLSPVNTWTSSLYFLCVTLFTLLVWSFFGGAITRIAVVQLARGEKIGIFEAIRFVSRRFLSYAIAPLFVLGFCFVLTVIMALLYLIGMIPVVGDFVTGLIFPIYFVMGLIMAVALVGLVGWPLMAATISAEGTDSWEAVSRSYSYVYQRPWHYIGMSLIAILYGGICVFFIGFMASFSVYLAKWGMSRAPLVQTTEREPNFLFIYAPTSFGWRELLLEGTQVRVDPDAKNFAELERFAGANVVQSRASRTAATGRWSRIDQETYDAYLKTLAWWNKAGAMLTSFWLGLLFLMMLGFGYSFFWTASTIIYLLLRKSVDAAELDEVYLEEDDYEPTFQPQPAPAPAPPATPARSLPIVEAPAPAPTPVATAVPAPTPMATPAPTPAPISEPKVEPKPPEKPDPPATEPEKKTGDEGKPPVV